MSLFKEYYLKCSSFLKDDKRSFLLILVLIVISAVLQLIIYNSLPVILVNDSVWYLDQTRFFAAGGFVPDYYASLKSVHGMINYPFGYPLFLDFCHSWGPTLYWGRNIVLFQHFLSLGSVVLLFLIGQRINHPIEGFCAAIAYTFYLPRLIYIQAIMAETVFVFLVLMSMFIFFGILFKKSNKYAGLFLGAVVAFSILTKPLAIFGALIFLVYLLIYLVNKECLIGFVLSFIILVSSNYLYNLCFYNECVLTTTSASHLADRVFGFDRLTDFNNPETKEIIWQCKKSGYYFEFPSEWWHFEQALRSQGLSSLQGDHLILKAALAGIYSNPSLYIKNTWVVFKKNILEEDQWFKKSTLMTKDSYFKYLQEWSTYFGNIDQRTFKSREEYLQYLQEWSNYSGKYIPMAEFKSRQKILNNIAVDYPQGSWHNLGISLVNFFDYPLLKWRGWMGWVVMGSLLYGIFARERALLFISLFITLNLLLIAMTESPFPRYFESFVPLAMLVVFWAVSTYWKRNFLELKKLK